MIVNIFIINISTISFIHICNMNDISNICMVIIMALPLSYPSTYCDIIHVADRGETYGTYVDDEYVDNHDYYDDTDDDT